VAGKGSRTHRRVNIAHQELVQLGLLAKISFFRVLIKEEPALVDLVNAERTRISREDKEKEKSRREWTPNVRLKVELAECIELLHSIYTPLAVTQKTSQQKLESVARDSLSTTVPTSKSSKSKSKSNLKVNSLSLTHTHTLSQLDAIVHVFI
jgi:hypothetical protein